MVEGTYEYLSEDNLLRLTYYDEQTYVYSVQIQNDGLRVELIDAYQHYPTDFNFLSKGHVTYWKKWNR